MKWRTWTNLVLINHLFGDRAKARFSSSTRGVHVLIDTDVTPEQEIWMREQLGDDYSRISWDKYRLQQNWPTSILFDDKNGGEAGEWVPLREFIKWVNPKPFWSGGQWIKVIK
jgi:hypothetical protein